MGISVKTIVFYYLLFSFLLCFLLNARKKEVNIH